MKTLKDRYKSEIAFAMMEKFGYKNKMEVPRLDKIVLNRGVGEIVLNPKAIEIAVDELTAITGQKPLVIKAKKAIAGFKLRKGVPIGCKVTLRGNRMYQFMEKLINICLPKIRDFKGINPNSFDGRGNYSMGVTEQLIFPEIDYNKVDKARGMDITICTTSKNNEEAKELLRLIGMPYRA